MKDSLAYIGRPCKMPGRIPCNEAPMSEAGDFVVILANLSRQVLGIEEPPVYVVHEEPTSGAIRYFWASVHIYGGNPSLAALTTSLIEQPPTKPKPISLQPKKL
ncbi:hypothetical protein D1007_25487 [Hordeum vulgare]|nr:hypothetical protein D1007_25487 [Hordeum vulgare]